MKNRYQIALDMQDACNPRGVLYDLQTHMGAFCESPSYTGTASVKADAALQLMTYKLAELMGGMPTAEAYSRAYQTCKRMAHGPSDQDISAAVRGTLGAGT